MSIEKAFRLLILFLERHHGQEKSQVIDYYTKNMQQLGVKILFRVDNEHFNREKG